MSLYISNMCQAGFIHKETSNLPYQHPFLFCHFPEEDFVDFVENFNDVDFRDYKKLSYTESRVYKKSDIYNWDILNSHLGIRTFDTPVIEFKNGIQISYPHILSNGFDEKYKKRLERFLNLENKDITFIFRVKSFMDESLVRRFYKIKNVKKVILFDEDVPYAKDYKENATTKILITFSEHQRLVKELKRRKIL